MSKKQKDDRYTKAIESGIWWDEADQAHDYEAMLNAFAQDLLDAPMEDKGKVMRRYGIWFGPQR